MRLDGKVTLITGVSQYMGPAFTKTFTDAGAVVCTQDRTRADAEPHAEYARKNPGGGLSDGVPFHLASICSNTSWRRSRLSSALSGRASRDQVSLSYRA